VRWPSFKETRRQLAAEAKQRVKVERRAALLALIKTLARRSARNAKSPGV
jgi:hypothetical protein